VAFELVYVLQSAYSIRDEELALTPDLRPLPGVQLTDESPWRRVFDVWRRRVPSLADALIVAVAMANRYEAVATFDAKPREPVGVVRPHRVLVTAGATRSFAGAPNIQRSKLPFHASMCR
jgi:hypothetical protein